MTATLRRLLGIDRPSANATRAQIRAAIKRVAEHERSAVESCRRRRAERTGEVCIQPESNGHDK